MSECIRIWTGSFERSDWLKMHHLRTYKKKKTVFFCLRGAPQESSENIYWKKAFLTYKSLQKFSEDTQECRQVICKKERKENTE